MMIEVIRALLVGSLMFGAMAANIIIWSAL